MTKEEFDLLDELCEPIDSTDFEPEEIKILINFEANGFVKRQWIITDEGSEFLQDQKEGEQ